jgi:hypothetical protein
VAVSRESVFKVLQLFDCCTSLAASVLFALLFHSVAEGFHWHESVVDPLGGIILAERYHKKL